MIQSFVPDEKHSWSENASSDERHHQLSLCCRVSPGDDTRKARVKSSNTTSAKGDGNENIQRRALQERRTEQEKEHFSPEQALRS
jgi:hypothetical protein